MIKILTLDEYPVVLAGFKQVFADTTDLEVVADASSVKEALRAAKSHKPHVIVIDVSQPGCVGLDFLRKIETKVHYPPTLAFGSRPDDDVAIRALRAGAAGFVPKQASPAEITAAVRKVAAGEIYLSKAMAERLALSAKSGNERLPHERLSNREYQVMCLLASGNTVSELARDLSLSVQTISTHRRRILDKMNLSTTAAITYYGVTNRLID